MGSFDCTAVDENHVLFLLLSLFGFASSLFVFSSSPLVILLSYLLPVMCGKYRRLHILCVLLTVVHRACDSHCTVSATSAEASIAMLSMLGWSVWSGLRCQELSIEGSVLHFSLYGAA
ncbi:hypothetical protein VTN49DRAFT_3710 [Thermomyces lanuginosus]|uniref:uncharacterized protein n=1 Tax=Thermomyces lanuginosus TaxID=5541 RepID=UPI00374307D0